MTGLIGKTILGATLAATTLTAALPAEAQRWRHRDRGGDVAAGALLGGVVGLGIGAAIASNRNDRWRYRDRYYDRGGYYDRRGYYDRGYYAPRGYYRDRGYYAAPRGYYDGYYGAPRYRGGYGYYGW